MAAFEVVNSSGWSPLVRRFASLLEPVSDGQLEHLAHQSHVLTKKYFGKAMRLFAPLYLSNECINSCKYCGFSRENGIVRVTLKTDEVVAEARHLATEGFRHILLVAGEHPRFIPVDYLVACVERLAPEIPSISLEVAPLEVADYGRLVQAGAEGLIVYQETYDREIYAGLHTAGPKKDYAWRLECAERAYDGGFRRLGIGALFGLAPWHQEALALGQHLEFLLKRCWKAQINVSLPRLRPAAGEFLPRHAMSDRELVQLVCALRVCFPQNGIVLSTREDPALRDALLPLGITMMSAGSHTEPGGYTGQGGQSLHQTVRGKQIAVETESCATEQFAIADHRSPAQVADLLRRRGFDPVWKDWDQAILSA